MCVKRIAGLCLVVLLVACVALARQAPSSDPIMQRALVIHGRAITLDSHVDILTTYATDADILRLYEAGRVSAETARLNAANQELMQKKLV